MPSEDPVILEQPDSTVDVEANYGLYPYQRQITERIRMTLSGEVPKAMVHMPTGSGKTRTAMNYICELFRRSEGGSLVFWMAESEELCEQAAKEFERSWTNLGNRTECASRLHLQIPLARGANRRTRRGRGC